MKNFKVLAVVISLLITVNCALIIILWYKHFHKPPPISGQAYEYLTKQLKLTPEQEQKYSVMHRQHAELTRNITEEQRMQRDSFFDYLKDPKANPAIVKQLEKRILVNQGKLDSATFYHFRDFRAILNPQQQSKFDSMMQDVLHMMMNRPRQQDGPLGPPPVGQQRQWPPHEGGGRLQRGQHPGKPGPGYPPMGGPPPGFGPDSAGHPPGGRPYPPPGRRPMGPPPDGGPPPQ